MWNVFKLTNLLWLFISTYWWITAGINQGPILIVINTILIVCLGMMPIKIRIDAQTGRIFAAILLLTIWYTWIDGPVMGLTTFLLYLPVLFLLQLPLEYKEELLKFTTKWYSILISLALVEYLLSLFISLPSIGTFEHPPYPPYDNHIFYIKTTFDYGIFLRFNACFLEPGHQAILSTFIIIANRYRFKECPWLWPLALAVAFSFSLAGYILLFIGFCLIKINSLWQVLTVAAISTIVTIGAINWAGGDNTLNELIISRLEKDDTQGIKGNNRFYNDTDFVYSRAVKKGDIWTGVKQTTNMDLVGGAGFKIYIINYGLVGVILVLLFYLSVIPPKPDYRYTIGFFIVISLCFLQRSYPFWYSWLFPFVTGIYIAKGEKDKARMSELDPTESDTISRTIS